MVFDKTTYLPLFNGNCPLKWPKLSKKSKTIHINNHSPSRFQHTFKATHLWVSYDVPT